MPNTRLLWIVLALAGCGGSYSTTPPPPPPPSASASSAAGRGASQYRRGCRHEQHR